MPLLDVQKLKALTVKVPQELYRQLQLFAAEHDLSQQEIEAAANRNSP